MRKRTVTSPASIIVYLCCFRGGMVHQVMLCKLKPEIAAGKVEDLMRHTRSQLLKIPEFRTITCGKRIDADNEWAFFLAAAFESLDKMRQGQRTPAYKRFEREVLLPNVQEQLSVIYELDPEKDTKYS